MSRLSANSGRSDTIAAMKALKILGRVLLGIVALVVVLALVLVGVVVGDGIVGKKATDFTNAQFPTADGTTVHGYLAQPAGPGPHPAMLMIHEFWGLNKEIIEMADKLAAEGYVVLAVDTYRGATTSLVPRAIYLVVNTPEDRVMQDLQGAFDYLTAQPNVDKTKIGVMGFCYGGGMSLRFGVRNPNLAATLVYYGSPITDPAKLGALNQTKGPVFGAFGENDTSPAPAAANAFKATLEGAGIKNQITVYPGVGHAFVQPSTISSGSAQQAWQDTLKFLNDNVKNKTATATIQPAAQLPEDATLEVIAYAVRTGLAHMGMTHQH